MTDLQQNFLSQAAADLRVLKENLNRDFAEEIRRAAFRTVHTIKGGARAFGYAETARLAHELEDFLGLPAAAGAENFRALVDQGLQHLIDSLTHETGDAASDFLNAIEAAKAPPAESSTEILLTQIPSDVWAVFSETERAAALAALRQRRRILCAEVGFARRDFAAHYRALRKTLGEHGDVIAALPSRKFEVEDKIGFRLFIATAKSEDELKRLIENFTGEIVSHTCADEPPRELYEMFAQLAAHGERTAAARGKTVEINVLASDVRLGAEKIRVLFEILLHLMNNAVDHAIERAGRIEINLFAAAEELILSFADNGRGVDLVKIRERAAAANLIAPDAALDDETVASLVFASGVSTAREVTEISGRGVGLEAVKSLVEKIGGKIIVKTRKDKGTTFELRLPKEEEK